MKYESKIFGKVDWPWWHDALILGVALGGVLLLDWWAGL